MPTYSYECGRCKKKYDYFHHGSDDKKAKCPYCGSSDPKKLPTTRVSHILKGKGWAKDGYGR